MAYRTKLLLILLKKHSIDLIIKKRLLICLVCSMLLLCANNWNNWLKRRHQKACQGSMSMSLYFQSHIHNYQGLLKLLNSCYMFLYWICAFIETCLWSVMQDLKGYIEWLFREDWSHCFQIGSCGMYLLAIVSRGDSKM
jgi:hypothetical protein